MTKNKKQYNKNIGNTKAMGVGGGVATPAGTVQRQEATF